MVLPEQIQQGIWVVLANENKTKQLLAIEPYGIGWHMAPGQEYYVFLKEKPPHLPEIVYYEEGIQVFASEAIVYRDGELLFDYSDTPVPPPKFKPSPQNTQDS